MNHYTIRSKARIAIALFLVLYCVLMLFITHMKTKNTIFAQEVNKGFVMSTVTNLVLLFTAIVLLVPRAYIR